MSDWIDLLISGTSESEAPERWYYWSGLAAVAAVVRKNIFLDKHYYRLYPNIYVALISAQPGQGKGVPLSICKSLLEAVDSVRVISGCNSVQGMIKELSTQKTFESGTVVNEAQAILVSDEFATFLTEDPRSLTDLTALYNSWEHEKSWVKTLKGSGIETLKSPCLSMLVASNQVLFEKAVKISDRDGGFISRTFIVYEKESRLYNSLVHAPKTKLDKGKLAEWLKEIGQLKGEFKYSQSGAIFYDEWYNKFRRESSTIDDPTGTLGRFGDSVLKVAMLLSAASTKDLILTDELISRAVISCESCLPAVKITGLSGVGEVSEAIAKVMKLFINAPDQTISRISILQKLNMKGVDAIILDRVIESLTQANVISKPKRDDKGRIAYVLKKEIYERYVGIKGEIQ